MSGADRADYEQDEYFDEPCCCCDRPLREGGDHINWTFLSKRVEWDYPAMGNVAYDIPSEYAMALVCDECIEQDADVEWVLKGEDLERVDPDDLEDIDPIHVRIIDSFDRELVDQAYTALEELIDGLRGSTVPKVDAARYVAVDLDLAPDTGGLLIDRLIRDDRLVEGESGDVEGVALASDHP